MSLLQIGSMLKSLLTQPPQQSILSKIAGGVTGALTSPNILGALGFGGAQAISALMNLKNQRDIRGQRDEMEANKLKQEGFQSGLDSDTLRQIMQDLQRQQQIGRRGLGFREGLGVGAQALQGGLAGANLGPELFEQIMSLVKLFNSKGR